MASDSCSCSVSVLLGRILQRKPLFLALALAGCQQPPSRDLITEGQINSLRERLDALQEASTPIGRGESIILVPSATEYTVMQTHMGPVTIAIKDVQPYADGSRLRLQIGNPSAARFENVTVAAIWGEVDSSGQPVYAGARDRQLRLEPALPSGTFANRTVTLEGFPPARLGFLQLTNFHVSGVAMNSPPMAD